MEKISVAVRFRPSTGEDAASARYWKVDNNNVTLHKSLGSPVAGVSFSYDHVFDHSCNNLTIYNVLTKSIIDAAVNGFNGTAFAYGQTSSGKTYTMNGSENDPGIIQLAVNDVFSSIEKIREREFLIRVSYMEIYNEEINDLLAVENQKLQIHESLDRGIFVAGLREEIVDSAEQVSKLLMLGEANRHFGETNMNIRSSRSHTIFRMVIESRAKDTQLSCDFPGADSIRVSVLNLVDLAGSERIAKTGADGVRLKEGKHINKSLMALGNVINKLSDGGKQKGHIPYRDSKLTRILQPALGGNAKTSIVCTVAPEELHIEETRGTLQFASRAKRITNCAQVNEILTDAALLKRQKLEIEELRKKLQGSHSELLEQVILKQRNDMLKSELECEKLAIQLEQEKRSREALENKVKEQQMMIDSLKNLTCFSEVPRNLTQECVPTRQLSINDDVGGDDDDDDDDGDDDDCLLKKSNLRTPDFGNLPCEFVTRRRDYSTAPNFCPLAETLGNNTDEDTWLHLNGGFSADLNMLQLTPEQGPQESLMVFQEQRRCPDAETCDALERECSQLREDKSSLMDALASSKEMTELLNAQKEELRAELDAERLKMKDLREEIGSFDELLSKRDGLLQSLYTRSQVIVGNLRGHHQW